MNSERTVKKPSSNRILSFSNINVTLKVHFINIAAMSALVPKMETK